MNIIAKLFAVHFFIIFKGLKLFRANENGKNEKNKIFGKFYVKFSSSFPVYWHNNDMHTVSLIIVIYFVQFSSRISHGHNDNKLYILMIPSWIYQCMSRFYYEYLCVAMILVMVSSRLLRYYFIFVSNT